MGFIIVAKNDRLIFLGSDLLWTVVHIGLAWTCVRYFGLNGTGMAFFGSYVFNLALIYAIVRRRTGFRWSRENIQTGMLFLSLIGVTFCAFYLLPGLWTVGLGTVALALSCVYSIRVLLTVIPWDQTPRAIQKLLMLGRPKLLVN
jgi:PST family polysaccharide transporter